MNRINALLGIGDVGIVDEVISTVSEISNLVYTDNIFIKYRDACFAIIFANFPKSVYDPILAKYKLGHSSIPDRKIGKTYAEEFGRLHQAIAELLDTRKTGLGSVFLAKSTEFAQKYITADPSRSYKGAPDEALSWVLANPNAVTVAVPGSTALTVTTQSPGAETGAPQNAEASFDVAPNTRMLMIGGGVLLLGAAAYAFASMKKKKGMDGVKPEKKARKKR